MIKYTLNKKIGDTVGILRPGLAGARGVRGI